MDALAADIRAHLAGSPVSARAPSAGYLLSKVVARNKLAVGAAGLGLAGLLLGLGLSVWQGRQAAAARDEASRQLASVKHITTELVFRFGDVISTLPGGAAAQEAMLKQTVAPLELALQTAPADADLIALVASALGRLAQIQGNPTFSAPERANEASATVARALALADIVWPDKRGDWRFVTQHLITLLTRAQLLRGQGQPAEGLKVLALAAQRCDEALAETLPDEGRANLLELRANVWVNMAHFNDHAGRPSLGQPQAALLYYQRAETDFRALYGSPALAAAMNRQAVPGEPPADEWRNHNLANVLAGRALVHQRLGNDEAMRQSAEAALLLRQDNLRRNPRSVTWRQSLMFDSNTLAIALLRLTEDAAALTATQRSWDIAGELARAEGAQSAFGASRAQFAPRYGRALAAAGRHAEALPVCDLGLARLAVLLKQKPLATDQLKQATLQVLRARPGETGPA